MMWPSLLFLLLCLAERTDAFAAVGQRSTSRLYPLPAVSNSFQDGRDGNAHHVSLRSGRREFVAQTIAAGFATNAVGQFIEPALADEGTDTLDPSVEMPKITHKVYLDVKFGNYKPKKLVIGLFGDVMPKAVENFLTLCTNTEGPSYSGATFYRVLSGMSIQGGAIGNASGKSGLSAFEGGKPFSPDNYNIRHTKSGLVSAVRGLNGDIDSRFFIQTENDAGWADGRYAAFGIVLEEEEGTGGMDLVRRISKVDVKPPQNSPKDPVSIVGCGVFGDT